LKCFESHDEPQPGNAEIQRSSADPLSAARNHRFHLETHLTSPQPTAPCAASSTPGLVEVQQGHRPRAYPRAPLWKLEQKATKTSLSTQEMPSAHLKTQYGRDLRGFKHHFKDVRLSQQVNNLEILNCFTNTPTSSQVNSHTDEIFNTICNQNWTKIGPNFVASKTSWR
jgi:hypothetical protein